MSCYRLIDAEKAHHPVAQLARVLGVARAGDYAWACRPPSDRSRSDALLGEQIRQIHDRSRGTYGAPPIHAELRLGLGVHVSRKRVARIMCEHGRQGVHRRRRGGLTRRDPAATPAPDLVQRRFAPPGPDQLWVADITQQRTDQGWLYLAVVLDAFSRRVVGWSMADHLRTELVLDALDMAVAESFFATLECELLDRYPWPTRAGLRTAIFDFIEVFYNRQRRHSTLDYHPPAAYEQHHASATSAA